jgi:hypothetical protein
LVRNHDHVQSAIRPQLNLAVPTDIPGTVQTGWENIDVFDFGLSAGEVEAISALNRNERSGPDPDRFDMV